jgi:hypothetical protein
MEKTKENPNLQIKREHSFKKWWKGN